MKKTLLLFLFIFSVFGCSNEKEDIKNINTNSNFVSKTGQNLQSPNSIECSAIQQSSAGFLSALNCSLTPIHPFTSQLNTYTTLGANPAYQNFGVALKSSVFESVYFHLNGVNYNPAGRLKSRTLITQSTDYIYLSQIINTSDLYPQITAQKANVVASKVICKYVDQIQNLYVTNPIPGASYALYIDYLNVDFAICGGPENTYVTIGYSIYKEIY